MAKLKTGLPYVWVTWLAELVSGLQTCEWKLWFRARYWYTKRASDFDFDADQYQREHAKLVAGIVNGLPMEHEVSIEDGNAFKLAGRAAIIAGKPDIIESWDGEAVVIDAKGGKPKKSDRWQVLVYLYALPHVGMVFKRLSGRLIYGGGMVEDIDPIHPDEKAAIETTMMMVASDMIPPRKPTPENCRFCDIEECPERYIAPPVKEGETDAF